MKKELFAFLLCSAVIAGCSKKEEQTTGQVKNVTEPAVGMSEPTVEKAPPKVGVDICDSFLEKYRTCVAELPEDMKASMQQGLDRTEQAWKALVEKATDQQKLVDSCQQMEASVSKVMKAQGCIW